MSGYSNQAIKLRFATNGVAFDFEEYFDLPSTRYIIASSPRCGSNMLQRSLWRTKMAGAPEEYLTEAYLKDFANRWDVVQSDGSWNIDLYIKLLFRFRTSPNGVFGVKVHGSHLSNRINLGRDVDADFQSPRYICIRRSDKLLQAVSYALAKQTGIWILDGIWLPDKEPITRSPIYQLDQLVDCMDDILTEERAWDEFFAVRGLTPLVVWYEDLVGDYTATMEKVFQFLNVSISRERIEDPGIRRQISSLNYEWAGRLREDLIKLKRVLGGMRFPEFKS